MPFKSEKQRRYLWGKRPDIARRWAEEEKVAKSAFGVDHGSEIAKFKIGGLFRGRKAAPAKISPAAQPGKYTHPQAEKNIAGMVRSGQKQGADMDVVGSARRALSTNSAKFGLNAKDQAASNLFEQKQVARRMLGRMNQQ